MLPTEDVYGVPINKAGNMSKLAKTLLNMHVVFMLIYLVTGIIQVMNSMSPLSIGEQEANVNLVGNSEGTYSEALLGLIVSIAVFTFLRKAIKDDNQEIMTGIMLCDGCCAGMTCLQGGCLFLGIAGIMIAKSAGRQVWYDDLCTCQGVPDNRAGCDKSGACCRYFDEQGCRKAVDEFHDGFAGMIILISIRAIVVCGLSMCCIFATMQLSAARDNMRAFPFCSSSLPGTPTVIGSTMIVGGAGSVVMGSPNTIAMGTVVVGHPVQAPSVVRTSSVKSSE